MALTRLTLRAGQCYQEEGFGLHFSGRVLIDCELVVSGLLELWFGESMYDCVRSGSLWLAGQSYQCFDYGVQAYDLRLQARGCYSMRHGWRR
jgi:hypothetical protein